MHTVQLLLKPSEYECYELELKRKVEAAGGVYAEVDTKEFKASQYNHVTDTYEKIPLSQRRKR